MVICTSFGGEIIPFPIVHYLCSPKKLRMKIICVGRNYAQHIAELQNEKPDQPVIFLKPESALAPDVNSITFPKAVGPVHFECEFVLRLSKSLPLYSKIESIHDFVSECTLGIDFTARELQTKLKNKGLPWELAKAFDQSAVLGTWIPLPKEQLYQTEFEFMINGIARQHGKLSELLFSFEEIINFCSQYFSLQPGDIIFTGTPAGVGPIKRGDELSATIKVNKENRSLLAATMA